MPARCGFWAVPGGVAVEVVAQEAPNVRRAIEQSLEEYGVPVRELHLVEHQRQLRHPFPLRGDLREVSFSQPVAGRTTEVVGKPMLPQHAEIGK